MTVMRLVAVGATALSDVTPALTGCSGYVVAVDTGAAELGVVLGGLVCVFVVLGGLVCVVVLVVVLLVGGVLGGGVVGGVTGT
jgi:hypothetical protein